MSEYYRPQFKELKSRIHEQRDKIQVIVGPRQVGKSTLVRQVLEHCAIPYESVSADDQQEAHATWLEQTWHTQRMRMDARNERQRLLVVDEIHKIPNWSEIVKAEWDRDTRERRALSVVLLGSSRMLLEKGLTESLAGRYELLRMSHWTLTEMQECFGFTLQQYVFFGGYPGAARYVNDERRWRRYVRDSLVEPAIQQDILMDTKILKPQLMRQLFELGSRYSGELLSLTKVVGQLQDAGNVTTMANYLHLLDEAGLLCGLQKFAQDEARRYNSVPKFQVHNSALRNAYADTDFQTVTENAVEWGRYAESAVGAYLVSQSANHDFRVFYWRERQDEVDYVLVRNGRVVAIEVKSGRRSMNGGLVKFQQLYKPHRAIIVGTGGLSFDEFLTMNLELLFR